MLEELTRIWGVSGREKRVTNYIIDQIIDYADEIKRDAMGNLIALKKGNGDNKKKIMTAAHMCSKDNGKWTVTSEKCGRSFSLYIFYESGSICQWCGRLCCM